MWIRFVRENIVLPGIGKLGTALATWLLANGHSSEVTDTIVLGVLAASGVIFDLVVSRLLKARTEEQERKKLGISS